MTQANKAESASKLSSRIGQAFAMTNAVLTSPT
eukprot:CAMPEP_0182798906 /NCGR_PEP_ID=MMETSP0006_2-20121128/1602_1 /TAXON_ID=97485 /ORGANISM="Prymnesium parvum, Strain Texoma1" /LENGTH=32 /DNA_ID= /DNA_START= /DNA_END= /DNA_ORIENTATION=